MRGYFPFINIRFCTENNPKHSISFPLKHSKQMKLFLAVSSLMFMYGKSAIMGTNHMNGRGNVVYHGEYNDVNGRYNEIDGYANSIDGDVNAVHGNVNDLNGHSNMVAGYGNHVSGNGNMIQGEGNYVVGSDATEEEKQMMKDKLFSMFAQRGISNREERREEEPTASKQQEEQHGHKEEDNQKHNVGGQGHQQKNREVEPEAQVTNKGYESPQPQPQPQPEPKHQPHPQPKQQPQPQPESEKHKHKQPTADKSGAYVVQGDGGFYYNLADTGEDLLGFDNELVFEDEETEQITHVEEAATPQNENAEQPYQVEQVVSQEQSSSKNLRKESGQALEPLIDENSDQSSKESEKKQKRKRKRQQDGVLSRYQRGGQGAVQNTQVTIAEDVKQNNSENESSQVIETADDYINAHKNSDQVKYIIVTEEPQSVEEQNNSRKVPIAFFAGKY